jgi:YggT family protein
VSSIGQIVVGLINLINLLVIIWCLLSWFPNIRWYDEPFRTLDRIVSPILAPFKKVIPPIGNIDISPMVAMIVLQMLGSFLAHTIP